MIGESAKKFQITYQDLYFEIQVLMTYIWGHRLTSSHSYYIFRPCSAFCLQLQRPWAAPQTSLPTWPTFPSLIFYIQALFSLLPTTSEALGSPTDQSAYMAYLPLAHILELLAENLMIVLGIPIGKYIHTKRVALAPIIISEVMIYKFEIHAYQFCMLIFFSGTWDIGLQSCRSLIRRITDKAGFRNSVPLKQLMKTLQSFTSCPFRHYHPPVGKYPKDHWKYTFYVPVH